MWSNIILTFMLACLCAYVLTPYSIKLAKKVGAIDIPDDNRKMHTKAMPRLGGFAIIVGFFFAIAVITCVKLLDGSVSFSTPLTLKLFGFFLGSLIIAMLGFLDDTKNVPALIKFFVQSVAAIIVIITGTTISDVNLPFFTMEFGKIVSYIVTFFWIVGITNAINLIDGLDGLSSGLILISSISLAIIFLLNGSPLYSVFLVVALAGAIAGFLPFNNNPAKTFVGDIGSNFMGYAIAVISIFGAAKTYTAVGLIAPIIVLAIPIFDTLFAIVRRIWTQKSIKGIMVADKGHIHHRLLKIGYNPKQVVVFLYLIAIMLGMVSIILIDGGIREALVFVVLATILIILGRDSFILKREHKDCCKEYKECMKDNEEIDKEMQGKKETKNIEKQNKKEVTDMNKNVKNNIDHIEEKIEHKLEEIEAAEANILEAQNMVEVPKALGKKQKAKANMVKKAVKGNAKKRKKK